MAQVGGSTPTVHGTWEDLFARIADGTYSTAYSEGEILPMDLGTQGVVGAQIVGFNKDEKADESGKAKVTFLSKYLLSTSRRFNPQRAGSSGNYTEGTGGVGGWKKSELRTYYQNTLLPLVPSAIRDRIVEVKKYSQSYDGAGVKTTDEETEDKVWAPSYREIANRSGYETKGPQYAYFNSDTRRKKAKAGSDTTVYWRLRTVGGTNSVATISDAGVASAAAVASQTAAGLAIGFCID